MVLRDSMGSMRDPLIARQASAPPPLQTARAPSNLAALLVPSAVIAAIAVAGYAGYAYVNWQYERYQAAKQAPIEVRATVFGRVFDCKAERRDKNLILTCADSTMPSRYQNLPL